ncbi:hypothetical protein RSOLAG1IB_10628 [Rhizoctonia solani AG-1 IB]|uniref:Uncharacterized protein n=1 Tax=Thanatephorus cucumeris (strain AG1-IB / isolate 7/3/14) TaxID=1108050 RepID=A0A0B7FYF6_THACB|nr:hypothetical protein RSOLAG1IB_10628 [Rhizoctonia solani AG-1 IB]
MEIGRHQNDPSGWGIFLFGELGSRAEQLRSGHSKSLLDSKASMREKKRKNFTLNQGMGQYTEMKEYESTALGD